MGGDGMNIAVAILPLLFSLIPLLIVLWVLITLQRMKGALETIANELKQVRIAMESEGRRE